MKQPEFTEEQKQQIDHFYQSIEQSRGVKVAPCADAIGGHMVIQLDAHGAIMAALNGADQEPYYVGLP